MSGLFGSALHALGTACTHLARRANTLAPHEKGLVGLGTQISYGSTHSCMHTFAHAYIRAYMLQYSIERRRISSLPSHGAMFCFARVLFLVIKLYGFEFLYRGIIFSQHPPFTVFFFFPSLRRKEDDVSLGKKEEEKKKKEP